MSLMDRTPPLNLICDESTFARGLSAAVAAIPQFVITSRPLCPTCQKPFGVTCTRVDAPVRVRYLMCRKCRVRATAPEMVPLEDAPQQAGPGRPRGDSRCPSSIPSLVFREQ